MEFNDRSSLLSYLRSRRSGRPRDMVAPGPDASQLRDMLTIAARTPDHGKLAPWRFVVIPADARHRFAALLMEAYRTQKPAAGRLEIEAIDQFARQAPTLVAVLSTPNFASHIPLWEQQLSAGAACMNLEHAAHAHGFVAGWLTGWAAFDASVCRALGGGEKDAIAGFVFIGSPDRPLQERPRPEIDAIVDVWTG